MSFYDYPFFTVHTTTGSEAVIICTDQYRATDSGSGSGSFHQEAKINRKTLISASFICASLQEEISLKM
jgi:hypothetical protein